MLCNDCADCLVEEAICGRIRAIIIPMAHYHPRRPRHAPRSNLVPLPPSSRFRRRRHSQRSTPISTSRKGRCGSRDRLVSYGLWQARSRNLPVGRAGSRCSVVRGQDSRWKKVAHVDHCEGFDIGVRVGGLACHCAGAAVQAGGGEQLFGNAGVLHYPLGDRGELCGVRR